MGGIWNGGGGDVTAPAIKTARPKRGNKCEFFIPSIFRPFGLLTGMIWVERLSAESKTRNQTSAVTGVLVSNVVLAFERLE